jgi:hypothetical protein
LLNQSTSKTKSDLLNEFDPIDPAVNIGKIKNLRDGSVLLKCANSVNRIHESIARSNEILGWEGVGNRQLLCFLKA